MKKYLLLCALTSPLSYGAFAQQRAILVAAVQTVSPYDSISYTHSNGRETNINGNNVDPLAFDVGFDKSLRWALGYYNTGKKFYKLETSVTRTYKTDNTLASNNTEVYDPSANTLTAFYYEEYRYNNNKTVDSFFYESYDIMNGPNPWKGGEKYIYDNLGRLMRKHTLSWDALQAIWVDLGASDSFFYDMNNRVTRETNTHGVIKHTYDVNGFKLTDTSFWGPQAYAWLYVYTYEPSGLLKSKEDLLYDITLQAWEPNEKTNYDYAGNNCIAKTTWKWDKPTNTYIQGHKVEYKYNSDDQLIQDGQFKYYYALPTDVPKEIKRNPVMSVYPTLAVTHINLDLNLDKPQPIAVMVTDMQGRIVKQFSDNVATAYHNSINIQHLPAGEYILQVMAEKETIPGRFIVIR
jgi:YD repeat-containing protein